MDIKKELERESEEKYRKFSMKLLPNTHNILGVRLGKIHDLAKEIVKDKDLCQCFFKEKHEYFEEIMLHGFIIAYGNFSDNVRFQLVKEFIPKIDNWSVCDSFCCALKVGGDEKYRSFAEVLIKTKKEFAARTGYVLLLQHFTEIKYKKSMLNILFSIKQKYYYAKMGQAWAVQKMYTLYPNEVYEYIQNIPYDFDEQTFNFIISKILDSRAISCVEKEKICKLKKGKTI